MAIRLNGWQRLWVFLSVPFVIAGLVVFYDAIVKLSSSDLGAAFGIGLAWPATMYAIGWGVAWVRRGFKSDK